MPTLTIKTRSKFGPKAGGKRYQGVVTRKGASDFERGRRQFASVTSQKPSAASDGDTMEYLASVVAHGVQATIERLYREERKHS